MKLEFLDKIEFLDKLRFFDNDMAISIYSINLLIIIIFFVIDAGNQKDTTNHPKGKSTDYFMVLLLLGTIGLLIGFLFSKFYIKEEDKNKFDIVCLVISAVSLVTIIVWPALRKDKNPRGYEKMNYQTESK
jgi:membrane-associated HD superfamily phosphohydrolase